MWSFKVERWIDVNCAVTSDQDSNEVLDYVKFSVEPKNSILVRMESLQSEEHFDRLLADHTYVFINVSAKWCKPCKAIQPQIFELIPQYKNIKFTVLDMDKLGDLADKGTNFYLNEKRWNHE